MKKPLNRSYGGTISILVVLALCGFFFMLPLVYVISNAFKPYEEMFLFPPKFLAQNPTLDNFRDMATVLTETQLPLSRYLFNTVYLGIVGVIAQIIFASGAAYALAKFDFPGKQFLSKTITLALMLSAPAAGVTNYIIMNRLGLIDTHWAIILPAAASTMGVYLIKQFMDQQLPNSLLEAARIDGANEVTILFKVAMPIVKPAWLTLLTLSIQSMWSVTGGNYIFSEDLKTLPTALSQISDGGIARMGAMMAVTLCTMSVPIISFVICQSNIMQTMATAGMKE